MIRVEAMASLDDPRLAPYRTMRDQQAHREQQLFVAEGEKLVRRLLESRFDVVSVLLPPKWLDNLRPLLEARPETIDVFVADKAVLEQLTGYSSYQGLLALGRVPLLPSLDQILAASPPPRLLVAADTLANAENLGALLRNCGAFRVQGVVIGETCCSPYLRRAVRSSMGAIFHLPILETAHLAGCLRELKRRGIRCIAAHPHAEQHPITHCDLTGDCCLVFGSEGHGLSPRVLGACDAAVAIPMPIHIDSLNVVSAAAVFLYEASRQRGRV
ncbi:MAG: RNA methyltransferase [Verrucomicrobia bacterium]|nr:RNA methyltransferase [Verrucomicrobiota bacterium]